MVILMEETLVKLYNELAYLEADIKSTERMLQDSMLDYNTRREFLNDVIYESRKVDEIKSEIEKLEHGETHKIFIKK